MSLEWNERDAFAPSSESPAEKRPVMSLVEDEATPNVSVINIFKQVKCTHTLQSQSWNNSRLTSKQLYMSTRSITSRLSDRPVCHPITSFIPPVVGDLHLPPEWCWTSYTKMLMIFILCFIVRSGWRLCQCASSSPSPSAHSQPSPWRSSQRWQKTTSGVSHTINFILCQ